MTVTETATSPLRPSLPASAYRLLVLHCPGGRAVGRAVPLDVEVVIGRGDDHGAGACVRLALEDPEVSRAHAAISRDGDALALADAGSRNGTFVNGARLTERIAVRDGDVIRVGAHLLLVQALGPTSAAPREPIAPDPELVGRSHRMLALLHQIREAPPMPTLVTGETGVGKELIARALHRASGRPGPLVAINCAALPRELAESELFGHVAGAFTGAADRRGLFVEADRGTLLLDEIGDMELGLQTKLLRAVATQEIRPVGADRPRVTDVRVIAATNRDLRAEVERGAFRGDLYARLMGVSIAVPPLRARREDILELAHHFLGLADSAAFLGTDAAEALLIHDWPFNVRELEQLCRRLGATAPGARAIELEQLPDALQAFYQPRRGSAGPRRAAAAPLVLGMPRRAAPTAPELEAALRAFAGNVAGVASHFGKDRRQIYRWAERLKVDIEAIRTAAEQAGEGE